MLPRLMVSLREEIMMNSREMFLNELEQLLGDISKTEREEALQYYREYFEDANISDEEVIEQLGSASMVANSIREELADKEVTAQQSETKEQWSGFEKFEESGERNQEEKVKTEMDPWVIAALVVLAILLSPVIIGVVATIFALVVSIIASVFAIFVTVVACTVAFAVGAVAALVLAFTEALASPLLAVFLIGCCLLLTGLCFLSILATTKMITFVIPKFVTVLMELSKMPFRKKIRGV